MSSTRGLVAAELLKLRTVRSGWAVLLVLPLVGLVSMFDAALDPVEHNTSLVDFMDVSFVVLGVVVASFAAATVGAEFQRRTIALDYLVVPARSPIVLAKVAAFAAVGGLLGLGAVAVAHAVVTPIAVGRDLPADASGDVVARAAAVVVASALVTALGAGIGFLITHPAVAAGVIVGWQVVEGVVGQALGIAAYLPIGLITTVAHLGGQVALPLAFALLLAYVVVVVAVAVAVARRRDLR